MVQFDPNGADRLNSFALVTYITGALGSFLDGLREELDPASFPKAHVTVLPPRPLSASMEVAWGALQSSMMHMLPFVIEAAAVEVFGVTSVVYIGIGAGFQELVRMHDQLNTGGVAFIEPFPYHPHITVAQGLMPEQVPEVRECAMRRWQEWSGERRFAAEAFTFVQNTAGNRWIDLAALTLCPQPVRR